MVLLQLMRRMQTNASLLDGQHTSPLVTTGVFEQSRALPSAVSWPEPQSIATFHSFRTSRPSKRESVRSSTTYNSCSLFLPARHSSPMVVPSTCTSVPLAATKPGVASTFTSRLRSDARAALIKLTVLPVSATAPTALPSTSTVRLSSDTLEWVTLLTSARRESPCL